MYNMKCNNYYLFGGWIRGSTLSQYELPCHYIYYRGQ